MPVRRGYTVAAAAAAAGLLLLLLLRSQGHGGADVDTYSHRDSEDEPVDWEGTCAVATD